MTSTNYFKLFLSIFSKIVRSFPARFAFIFPFSFSNSLSLSPREMSSREKFLSSHVRILSPCVTGAAELHPNCAKNPHCLLGLGEKVEGAWISDYVDSAAPLYFSSEIRSKPFVGIKVTWSFCFSLPCWHMMTPRTSVPHATWTPFCSHSSTTSGSDKPYFRSTWGTVGSLILWWIVTHITTLRYLSRCGCAGGASDDILPNAEIATEIDWPFELRTSLDTSSGCEGIFLLKFGSVFSFFTAEAAGRAGVPTSAVWIPRKPLRREGVWGGSVSLMLMLLNIWFICWWIVFELFFFWFIEQFISIDFLVSF